MCQPNQGSINMLKYSRNGRLRFLRIGRLQLSWCIMSRATYSRQRRAVERTRLARMVSPHYMRLIPCLLIAAMLSLAWPNAGIAFDFGGTVLEYLHNIRQDLILLSMKINNIERCKP
jgi:hypothetical protein